MNNLNVPIPTLSVVIPVYDEEAGLDALFTRTYAALDALGIIDLSINNDTLKGQRASSKL